MVCVFGSFVICVVRVLKSCGLGLAVAVFIEASIVRIVLVPAVMELLGKANWWFPRRLARIVPRLGVEVDVDDYFFFFQAEDGIRDLTVTGVQTCALPI